MIKKLLMLYWEIVPKYSADQKLLPEMILVCNALRNDLTSPNEFVRGCMLRFLCKMKEAELLEPLVSGGSVAVVIVVEEEDNILLEERILKNKKMEKKDHLI